MASCPIGSRLDERSFGCARNSHRLSIARDERSRSDERSLHRLGASTPNRNTPVKLRDRCLRIGCE
ncbi:hypothetical protein POG22_08480 [Geitlerinema sp. CS-897]|nr:hypothetical protein [Geitlerinema sp. CS-897]